MVESTVILSARIGAAELTTLVAGAWLFAGLTPIAGIATAVTAEIQIKKRKRFLTRATGYVESKTYSKVAKVHRLSGNQNDSSAIL